MDSNEQISLSNEQHENDRINSSNYNSSINNTPAISDNCNVNSVLRQFRLNHIQQIIKGHLNINYIRNKFDLMKTMLTRDINILMFTETKLDDSFPVSQFEIDGFSTPWYFTIHSQLHCSFSINYIFPNDVEAFFIETNIKGNK